MDRQDARWTDKMLNKTRCLRNGWTVWTASAMIVHNQGLNKNDGAGTAGPGRIMTQVYGWTTQGQVEPWSYGN
jgi:hypothetical protein